MNSDLPTDKATARQTVIGLGLGAAIVASWLVLHIYGVFVWRWIGPLSGLAAVLVIALQSWLGAGLFIVAHDAMHGSLAPGRRALNRGLGQLCVGLYAGFSFDKLNRAHHLHHRAPGSAEDPDFHADRPTAFWPWYVKFFREYFGWRELAGITVVLAVYVFVLHAAPLNAGLLWGLPAILSSLQLFVFGTYLPHRHGDDSFADRHNARSLEVSWLASLLACYHFGYHREHHLAPGAPWWRLPAVRAGRAFTAR